MKLNDTALAIVKRNKTLTEKISVLIDCSLRHTKERVIKHNLPQLLQLNVLDAILKHTNFETVYELVEKN